MEDFNALAALLAAGVGDARGCLIVSRDGLVMGAHPDGAEARLKPAWLLFSKLGEPDRSFVQFADEIWCYVQGGPYAVFVVTGAAVRPGLVIDQIEQALAAAEDSRNERDALKIPRVAVRPSAKPRTPRRQADPTDTPVVIRGEAPPASRTSVAPASRAAAASTGSPAAASGTPPARSKSTSSTPDTSEDGVDEVFEPAGTEPAAPYGGTFWTRSSEGAGDGFNDDEVDRVLLAREFSQLLQEDETGADG